MTIGSIRVHRLSVPLPRPLRTAIHNYARVHTVVVEMRSDAGLTGSGHCFSFGARAARALGELVRWQALYAEPLVLEDGCVLVPDRPGIALDLSPASLARFRA